MIATGIQYPDSTIETSINSAIRAIFGYGYNGSSPVSVTNLVSNTGNIATDTTGVGQTKYALAATGYGGDKAIFGYGNNAGSLISLTNLVSNLGVVSTDNTGVGTARSLIAATSYGLSGQAIFGYGNNSSTTYYSMTNLVSTTGVVATDTTGVGTARFGAAAAGYGSSGQALFGYGASTTTGLPSLSMTNLVSNTGVVATDTTGVGTARYALAAAGYGGDRAIFGFGRDGQGTGTGSIYQMTNLVSNTGVVAADVTGVGTNRSHLAAAGYGGDRAIFGYGQLTTAIIYNMTNLVANTGIMATDTTGIGTNRSYLAASSYSS